MPHLLMMCRTIGYHFPTLISRSSTCNYHSRYVERRTMDEWIKVGHLVQSRGPLLTSNLEGVLFYCSEFYTRDADKDSGTGLTRTEGYRVQITWLQTGPWELKEALSLVVPYSSTTITISHYSLFDANSVSAVLKFVSASRRIRHSEKGGYCSGGTKYGAIGDGCAFICLLAIGLATLTLALHVYAYRGPASESDHPRTIPFLLSESSFSRDMH